MGEVRLIREKVPVQNCKRRAQFISHTLGLHSKAFSNAWVMLCFLYHWKQHLVAEKMLWIDADKSGETEN